MSRRPSEEKRVFHGTIDGSNGHGELFGWAAWAGDPSPLHLDIAIDGTITATFIKADEFRPDLLEVGIGEGRHGFHVALPRHVFDGKPHTVQIACSEHPASRIEGSFLLEEGRVFVDHCDTTRIEGWAFDPPAQPIKVELVVGEQVLSAALARKLRSDVEAAGFTGGKGWEMSIPLAVRGKALTDWKIRLAGQPTAIATLQTLPERKPRVLFITNAESETDGSRIYRSELPARNLQKSGVDASVLSETEVRPLLDQGNVSIGTHDVVIFQRVPFSKLAERVLEIARDSGSLVLYEADDLMFKPWRKSEIGLIRSGVISVNDKEYTKSLSLRLDMIQLCDGVITSTAYLQRELRSLGFNTILSRNFLEDELFAWGAWRLAQAPRAKKEPLKLLFMSGTRTHGQDFRLIEGALHTVLSAHEDVTLTILGCLDTTPLDTFVNVKRLPLVSRQEIFGIIAAHDVTLVPLERTGFNTGKSSLKLIESAAAAVPVIASPLYEYRRDIQVCGEDLIASDEAQWIAAIKRFIEHPGLSLEIGKKVYRYAIANYSSRARSGHLWSEICRLDAYISANRVWAQTMASKLARPHVQAVDPIS